MQLKNSMPDTRVVIAGTVPTTIAPWVAMSGPIGWTLIGLGSLAIPVGWTIGRLRQKDRLRQHVQQQVGKIFQFLMDDRLKLIRASGEPIVEEYRERAEQQRQQLEAALARGSAADTDPEVLPKLQSQDQRLTSLLLEVTQA
jgi:hypothetical protein